MWIYNGGWNETPGSPTTAAIWTRSFEWRRRDCDFAGMRRPFGYSSKDRHRPYYATASSAERQVRSRESGSTRPKAGGYGPEMIACYRTVALWRKCPCALILDISAAGIP